MKFENYLLLEFPAKSVNESFARSAVACFASQMDPTMEELGDIKTAVSEAICIKCRILKDDVIDITIKDRGIGIEDIEKARQPMYTTGGDDRSGMGFTIMETFMTDFQVRSVPGKGTTVRMRRKLQSRK